jgi:hypothetical protein
MSDLINQLFHEVVKVHVLEEGDALTNASYPTSGNFVNVGGAHRFAVVGIVNAVNSAITVQAQQAITVDGTPKNIAGAAYVIPDDGSADGKWFIINVDTALMDSNNGYKFVTVAVSGAAGNNDTVTLLLLEFAGEKIPVTQPALASAVNVVG